MKRSILLTFVLVGALALTVYTVRQQGMNWLLNDANIEATPVTDVRDSALQPVAHVEAQSAPTAEPVLAEMGDDGDPELGAELFAHGAQGVPACSTCHAITQPRRAFGGQSIGPALSGLSDRAGERIPDTEAHDYIRQSILEPSAFIVPGYTNVMYPAYAQALAPEQLEDLLAYLLTL